MKSLKISILTIFLFSFALNQLNSQVVLSDKSRISLLTCNPGTELYSVFGHSAIRVMDRDRGIDWTYNYGTFQFDAPNFYMKFIRGQLNYQLSVAPMRSFLQEYQYYNRQVVEDVLDLTQKEKQAIFDFLEFNRQPENKYYLYDFFFDNCATRIRDVFQKELSNKIKFDNNKYEPKTFREMLADYLAPHPWARFGINVILGSIADRDANVNESMFLPDYMKIAFDGAKINNKNLVKSSSVIIKQKETNEETSFFMQPSFVFWSVFVLVLIFTYLGLKRRKTYKIIDFFVFLIIGAVGVLVFFMWFGTDHTATVKNWNLLWVVPTHFFVAFLVFRKSRSSFLKYYFLVSALSCISALAFWFVIPQQFDIAFVPLMLLVALRSLKLFFYYR